MKRTTITIRIVPPNGTPAPVPPAPPLVPLEIIGYTSPDWPGLAVHRHPRYHDTWTVSHLASGQRVPPRGWTTRRQAVAFVAALASSNIDWTRDKPSLEAKSAADPRAFSRIVWRAYDAAGGVGPAAD